MNKKFLGGKETSKILGVHQRTLYLWEKKWKDRNNKNTRRKKII
jgi:DNA-binding transcriptional MerR regulator